MLPSLLFFQNLDAPRRQVEMLQLSKELAELEHSAPSFLPYYLTGFTEAPCRDFCLCAATVACVNYFMMAYIFMPVMTAAIKRIKGRYTDPHPVAFVVYSLILRQQTTAADPAPLIDRRDVGAGLLRRRREGYDEVSASLCLRHV